MPEFSLLRCRLAASLLLFCGAILPVEAQNVERWIHSGFSQDYANVQLNNDEWRYPTVLDNTEVVQMFVIDVYNQGAAVDLLRARLALYRNHGIRLAVEGDPGLNADWIDGDGGSWYCTQPGVTCSGAGSVDDVARASAWRMLQRIKPLYDAGGELSYLSLGGYGIAPLIQGGGVAPSRGGNFTTEEAYAVLLKFMQYVHQGVWHLPPGGSSSDPEVFQPGHPEIKIGLILAIPNVWYANIPPWDGTTAYTPTIGGNDFGTILSEMIAAVEQGGETLWFLHCDALYNYTVLVEEWYHRPGQNQGQYDYVGRLATLRDQVRALGLRFGIVFNTNRDPDGVHEVPEDLNTQDKRDNVYFNETLAFIETYKQRFGDPDNYVVESWFRSPLNTFNEDTPLSFMNLVRTIWQPRISGGLMHSLVQRKLNAPMAAGQGVNGQLGNNGGYNSAVPVQVAAGFQSSDVASGYYDSLAVGIDGTVYTWGNNTYGQLGNGSSGGQANGPVVVSGANGFTRAMTLSDDGKQVIGANWGACAAVDDTGREESGRFAQGRVWMWGINYDGQLGDGTTDAHYTPQLVLSAPGVPLTDVVSIAVGSSHTAALRRDGSVVTWGTNLNGALGNAAAGNSRVNPVSVYTDSGQPLSDIVQLTCGGSRFCLAVRNDGTVWGWGANGAGQLGLGDTIDRYYATQIPNFGTIDRIAAGEYHAVAHSWANPAVYAWGYNGYGQLGRAGAPVIQASPFPMDAGPDNMTEITDVAAGGYFSLMIRGKDHKVFVVGDNQSGQLGINDWSARNVPVLSLY